MEHFHVSLTKDSAHQYLTKGDVPKIDTLCDMFLKCGGNCGNAPLSLVSGSYF